MDLKLKGNIIIQDIEKVVDNIKRYTDAEVDIEKMAEFINTNNKTKFYLNDKLELRQAGSSDIKMLLIDCGYRTADKIIFISTIRVSDGFEGFYVGTVLQLLKSVIKAFPWNAASIKKNKGKLENIAEQAQCKRDIPYIYKSDRSLRTIVMNKVKTESTDRVDTNTTKNVNKESAIDKEDEIVGTDDVIDFICKTAIIPWESGRAGVAMYISLIKARLRYFKANKITDPSYMESSVGNIFVRTGLVTIYGTEVCLMFTSRLTLGRVIAKRTDLLSFGFKSEDIMKTLTPIKFVSEEDVKNIPTKFSEFDISYANLAHIFKNREERLSAGSAKDVPKELVQYKLLPELQNGLRMCECDPRYIKFLINCATQEISYVLPFHVSTKFLEEPEFVMIIKRVMRHYEVSTVLEYTQDVKDKIIAASLYGGAF